MHAGFLLLYAIPRQNALNRILSSIGYAVT